MKTSKIFLTGVCLVAGIYLAFAGNPVYKPQTSPQQKTEAFEGRSILFLTGTNAPDEKQYKPFDDCKLHKRRQITGFILLPVGLGAMAGGAYMCYVGGKNLANSVSTSDIYSPESAGSGINKRDIALVGIGAATAFVGLILAPTGFILGLQGSLRRHRYCREEKSFYITPSQRGLGMAATF